MIRNKYRVNSSSLYYILMKSRVGKTIRFSAIPSAREANINWLKELHMNNKHTFGSEA